MAASHGIQELFWIPQDPILHLGSLLHYAKNFPSYATFQLCAKSQKISIASDVIVEPLQAHLNVAL